MRSNLQQAAQRYNHLRMRLKGAIALMHYIRTTGPYRTYRGFGGLLMSEETRVLAGTIGYDMGRLYELIVDDWKRHRAKLKEA